MNSHTLPAFERVVIKVGSSLIAPDGRGCSTRYLLGVARLIQHWWQQGRQVVLVSSGSVAAGRDRLPGAQPGAATGLVHKQALAAVGQTLLMTHWQRLFDRPCAQVLLTRADLQRRRRFLNARDTMEQLLCLDTLPVVNENDTLAVDELKLGDNDNLAAHVAVLCDADLLVILSDVDGLYDRPPQQPGARLLSHIQHIDERMKQAAGDSTTRTGTGGMRTKLQAARIAMDAGIHTLIVNGRKPDALLALESGFCPGSWFHASSRPLSARKHWLLHTQQSNGRLVVDAGAVDALTRGASMLPCGIRTVQGDFLRGHRVDILTPDGQPLAIGISQYDADELRRIAGYQTSEIASILGYRYGDEAVHRDDLVLNQEQT